MGFQNSVSHCSKLTETVMGTVVMPKLIFLNTSTGSNLRDRVLGEVEKLRLIALTGQKGHNASKKQNKTVYVPLFSYPRKDGEKF